MREFVITHVILATGACGREALSCSSGPGSGRSGRSAGSAGSACVFQTMVSFEAVLKNSPLRPPGWRSRPWEALGQLCEGLGELWENMLIGYMYVKDEISQLIGVRGIC